MKEEKNVQINLSFDMIKYIICGLLGIVFILNIITNLYIDDLVSCWGRDDNPVCHCLNNELKNMNIITKTRLLADIDVLEESKYTIGMRCAGKALNQLKNLY